jgi:hypothetical protein
MNQATQDGEYFHCETPAAQLILCKKARPPQSFQFDENALAFG